MHCSQEKSNISTQKVKKKKKATETQNMRLGNAKRTSQMHTQYPFGYSCQWLRFGFFFFEKSVSLDYVLFNGSRALFMGLTSTLFKKNFKTGSHSTIYTFKNYFATVFSVFSEINGIPTDPSSSVVLCINIGLFWEHREVKHFPWLVISIGMSLSFQLLVYNVCF